MIGEIKAFATSGIPRGHLLCDGSAVSRIIYHDLFALIGTTYGTGDGSTTFNLPNLKNKLLVGYNGSDADYNAIGKTGGVDAINIEHTHTQTDHTHAISGNTDTSSGAAGSGTGKTSPATAHYHAFGPFTSSGASNLGMNNQLSTTQSIINPYITMNFVIQYTNRKCKSFMFFLSSFQS